jgi:hypothetical protein
MDFMIQKTITVMALLIEKISRIEISRLELWKAKQARAKPL